MCNRSWAKLRLSQGEEWFAEIGNFRQVIMNGTYWQPMVAMDGLSWQFVHCELSQRVRNWEIEYGVKGRKVGKCVCNSVEFRNCGNWQWIIVDYGAIKIIWEFHVDKVRQNSDMMIQSAGLRYKESIWDLLWRKKCKTIVVKVYYCVRGFTAKKCL